MKTVPFWLFFGDYADILYDVVFDVLWYFHAGSPQEPTSEPGSVGLQDFRHDIEMTLLEYRNTYLS